MTGVILMLGRLARRHACNAHALQGGFQSALVDLFALELQVHRTGRASASFQYAKHRAHLFGHVAGASLMPDAGDRPGHVTEAFRDACTRGLGQLANASQRHHLRIEVHAQLARPLPLGRSNVDAVNAGPREQFALQALDARIGGIPHVGKHNGNVQAQLARGGIHIDLVSAAQMNLSVHSAGECHATARSLRPAHAIPK